MDQSIACKLLQAAMQTPAAVDELWGAHLSNGKPSSEATSLASRIGGDHEAALELARQRDAYLQFLRDPSVYPKSLYDEASSRFPLADLAFRFEIPPGFIRRRGFLALFERFTMRVWIKLTPPKARIPSIVVFNARPASCRFPWQEADDFHRNVRYMEYSSRYVAVANTTVYEASYHAQGDVWLEKVQLGYRETIAESQLYRVMIPIVTKGPREYLIMFATRGPGLGKAAFDSFVVSLR